MQPLQKNANSAILVAKSAIQYLLLIAPTVDLLIQRGGGALKRDNNKFSEDNWRLLRILNSTYFFMTECIQRPLVP
jgi:hypothetical protein